MACINVKVNPLISIPNLQVEFKNNPISSNCNLVDTIILTNIAKEYDNLVLDYTRYHTDLEFIYGMICIINPELRPYIKWENDKLVWVDDENKDGFVKYNILFANKEWNLEEFNEMIIEEIF